MSITTQPIAIALAISAAAGAASFLSPCVAPLVPGYLAFLAGDAPLAGDEPAADAGTNAEPIAHANPRPNILPRAFAFVAGFAIVFTVLGLGASSLGRALNEHRTLVELIGGFCIALLGLAMAFGRTLLPARASQSASSITTRVRRPATLIGATAIGMAFAVAWTPCIGPALAAILLLAGSDASPARGAALLFAYSLGLGIPFLIAAFGVQRFHAKTRFLRAHARAIQIAAGLLLVALGISIASGRFGDVTAQLARRVPDWLP